MLLFFLVTGCPYKELYLTVPSCYCSQQSKAGNNNTNGHQHGGYIFKNGLTMESHNELWMPATKLMSLENTVLNKRSQHKGQLYNPIYSKFLEKTTYRKYVDRSGSGRRY